MDTDRDGVPTSPRLGNRSYILALSLVEQLSAATMNLLSLAPLAVDWKAHMVEPVVLKSQLFGIKGIYSLHMHRTSRTQQSVRLSHIYKLDKLNSILHSHVSPDVSMVGFEEFFASAPKKVILFHFDKVYDSGSSNRVDVRKIKIVHAYESTGVIECSHLQSAEIWTRKVENHLNVDLSSSEPEVSCQKSPLSQF